MSKRYLQGVTLLIGLGDADAIQLNLRNTSGFVGNLFDSLAWICTVSLRLIFRPWFILCFRFVDLFCFVG